MANPPVKGLKFQHPSGQVVEVTFAGSSGVLYTVDGKPDDAGADYFVSLHMWNIMMANAKEI